MKIVGKYKILLLRLVSLKKIREHVRSARYPYNLFFLKAYLERQSEFELVLIDEMVGDNLDLDSLGDFDLVIIHLNTPDKKRFSELRLLLDPHKTIITGQAPTGEPHLFNDFVTFKEDYEREVTSYIVRRFLGQDTPKGESKDAIPLLDLDRETLDKYNTLFPIPINSKIAWGQLLTSRGCPHHCSFCTNDIRESYGNRMIFFPVKFVIEQIRLHLKNGANAIYFSDDDFTVSRKNVASICNELIDKNISAPWTAHARVDEVDLELLGLMKKSGCSLLRFGVESGDLSILTELKKTQHPDRWFKEAQEAFANCKKLKIPTVGLFIIGNPEESHGQIWKTIFLCLKLKPTLIQVHFFTPYPETKYAKAATTYSDQYHYSASVDNPSKISKWGLVFYRCIFYALFMMRIDFWIQNLTYYKMFYFKNRKNAFKLLSSLPLTKVFFLKFKLENA